MSKSSGTKSQSHQVGAETERDDALNRRVWEVADGEFKPKSDDLRADLVRNVALIDSKHVPNGMSSTTGRISKRLEAQRTFLRELFAARIRSVVEAHSVAGLAMDEAAFSELRLRLRQIFDVERKACSTSCAEEAKKCHFRSSVAENLARAVVRDCSVEFKRALDLAATERAKLELTQRRRAVDVADFSLAASIVNQARGKQPVQKSDERGRHNAEGATVQPDRKEAKAGHLDQAPAPQSLQSSPRVDNAWKQYEWILHYDPELLGNGVVSLKLFKALKAAEREGELPSGLGPVAEKKETFARYVRRARACRGIQMNTSRADRQHGSSIASRSEF